MKGRLTIADVMSLAPIIPVIVVNDVNQAVQLAKTLVGVGMPVLEVTLRTPVALDAIRAIKAEVEGAVVGAGTVLSEKNISDSVDAGAEFLVTPGTTPELIEALVSAPVPVLPGIATISEAMTLWARGFNHLKFFPAESIGGASVLKSMQGPVSELNFCPTGGVSIENMAEYLMLENVLCVGGSWMVAPALVESEDWAQIESLARQAVQRASSLQV